MKQDVIEHEYFNGVGPLTYEFPLPIAHLEQRFVDILGDWNDLFQPMTAESIDSHWQSRIAPLRYPLSLEITQRLTGARPYSLVFFESYFWVRLERSKPTPIRYEPEFTPDTAAEVAEMLRNVRMYPESEIQKLVETGLKPKYVEPSPLALIPFHGPLPDTVDGFPLHRFPEVHEFLSTFRMLDSSIPPCTTVLRPGVPSTVDSSPDEWGNGEAIRGLEGSLIVMHDGCGNRVLLDKQGTFWWWRLEYICSETELVIELGGMGDFRKAVFDEFFRDDDA